MTEELKIIGPHEEVPSFTEFKVRDGPFYGWMKDGVRDVFTEPGQPPLYRFQMLGPFECVNCKETTDYISSRGEKSAAICNSCTRKGVIP